MNTTVQNSIRREMILHAPKEKVFAAITDPAQIVMWFPDGIEGKLETGERPVFDFGKYGKSPIYVVANEPHSYFAYRWLPGGDYSKDFMGDVLTRANTLVEFRLEDVPEGTRLTLLETGFASLPAEAMAACHKDNTEGWAFMLDRLEKYLAS